jgi:hypothetical protein
LQFFDFTASDESLSLHLDGVGAYAPGPHQLSAVVTVTPPSTATPAGAAWLRNF